MLWIIKAEGAARGRWEGDGETYECWVVSLQDKKEKKLEYLDIISPLTERSTTMTLLKNK